MKVEQGEYVQITLFKYTHTWIVYISTFVLIWA